MSPGHRLAGRPRPPPGPPSLLLLRPSGAGGTWTPPEGTIAFFELVNRYTESQGGFFFFFKFSSFLIFFLKIFSLSLSFFFLYSSEWDTPRLSHQLSARTHALEDSGLAATTAQVHTSKSTLLPSTTDWGSNCTFLFTVTGESKQWNRVMGDLSHFPSCFHWFVHTILIIMKGFRV